MGWRSRYVELKWNISAKRGAERGGAEAVIALRARLRRGAGASLLPQKAGVMRGVELT